MSNAPFDPRTWPARLGVMPGATVQLMADVTRMAWNARRAGKRFDPKKLLEAFADAVGAQGLLLVPTFNFDLRDGDTFDARRTRSMSGALANAALEHPRFVRTRHPLHSFAVTGSGALDLSRATVPGSFDPEGPFGELHRRKGTLIALDLDLNDALTFTHYVEQCAGVTYRRHTAFGIHRTDENGKTALERFSIHAKRPGHINDFRPLEKLLRNDGALEHGEMDGSRWIRVDLARAFDVITGDIRTNNARSIHYFSTCHWLRETAKNMLQRIGFRTRNERMAHVARTA